MKTNNDEIGFYGYGWALYKSNGTAFNDQLYNATDNELKEWCLGFMGAMAEYPEFDSMRNALLFCNIDCRIIKKLCDLAKLAISESNEFIRLPNCPID